ncbi:Rha family transcriptional regulator [Porphyromonas gulae]|uniref:Rha family transcriptional regulator n=1 Tax=Porphyromonas gulae TaxID=111105 RepID=UPI0026EA5735|nr:Rha family transcriptional regulator [Porphyromonas gulae]
MNVQTGLDRSLNGQKRETMSSLQIAQLTGKRHKHVLEAIRAMEPAWEKVNGTKFRPVTYTDAKGENRPCYQLTKTECLYIATKFNDEARARLVLRWEELENQQRMEQSRELLDMMREVRALAKEVVALREQIGQGSRPAHRHEGFAE